MATGPRYTVLPVSALKAQATVVFDALKEGKTVYVTKHGRVGAAFRPYRYVPSSVAALRASPFVSLRTLTAREMGQSVPSAAVTAAAQGLPSLVEKESHIYGILTPAGVPVPAAVPDAAAVGAMAEAVNNYQNENPDATLEQIVSYSNSLDVEDAAAERDWFLGERGAVAQLDSDDSAVYEDIQHWRDDGSEIEDVVQQVLDILTEAIPAAASAGSGVSVQFPDVPEAVVDALHIGDVQATRETLLGGEKFEAAGETLLARASYLTALTADEHPSVGVMWRLGSLALAAGRQAEAARWFRISLTFDAIEQNLFTDAGRSLDVHHYEAQAEAR